MRKLWVLILLLGGAACARTPDTTGDWNAFCLDGAGASLRFPRDWAVGDAAQIELYKQSLHGSRLGLLSSPRHAGTKGIAFDRGQGMIEVFRLDPIHSGSGAAAIDYMLGENVQKVDLGRTVSCSNLLQVDSEDEEGPGAYSEARYYVCGVGVGRIVVAETHWKGDHRADYYRDILRKMVGTVRARRDRYCPGQ